MLSIAVVSLVFSQCTTLKRLWTVACYLTSDLQVGLIYHAQVICLR